MKIYDIDAAIRNLVDEETGEILDYEAFASLTMEREKMVESMALWHLELLAEAATIKSQEDRLKALRQQSERKAERLKDYLTTIQAGEKFKTPLVSISFRASESVEFADEKAFIENAMKDGHDEFLRFKTPEVNRTAIKEALKSGAAIEGVFISKNQNIQIK